MERYKNIKNTLLGIVESQLGNWQCVDAEELGEVVDMVKDMEEAMYYCSIVKAMEKQEKEKEAEEEAMKKLMKHQPQTTMYYTNSNFYPDPRYDRDAYRDLDKEDGKMYYSPSQPRDSRGRFVSENSSGSGMRSGRSNYGGPNGTTTMYYTERPLPYDLRDSREGRSPMSRRTYMESKELNHGKEKQMHELEKYMKELSEDITEIIEDASPEEKRIIHEKVAHLADKIK